MARSDSEYLGSDRRCFLCCHYVHVRISRFVYNLAFADQPAEDVEHQDDQDQDQRRRPGQFDLVLEGHARKVVDEDRQRGRRFGQAAHVVVAEQRGEQQRRQLARRAGDGQHHPGQDAGQAGRQHHFPDDLAAGAAHAVGRVLHALRHHLHRFLGGQHHGRAPSAPTARCRRRWPNRSPSSSTTAP